MSLTLQTAEIRVLSLNMNIMRKNIKKAFKTNYSKSEGKELLNVYDEVKGTLESFLDIEEGEEINIHFEEKELNMLHSFVNWYVTELTKLYEEAERMTVKKMNEEDREHLEILKTVESKVLGVLPTCIN